MIIFPTGIAITDIEHKSLLYMVADPEEWLKDVVQAKAKARQAALIVAWKPKLFADPDVTELPANAQELCELIMARDDYKTRLQRDADQDPPEITSRHNIARFEGTSRVGLTVRRPDRVPSDATVTLFPSGMDLSEIDYHCILAYVQELDDWVIGALLGQINRGKNNHFKLP